MNAPRSGCPINLTLEALGDRWSLIVIRNLMFGNRRHFRELLTLSVANSRMLRKLATRHPQEATRRSPPRTETPTCRPVG